MWNSRETALRRRHAGSAMVEAPAIRIELAPREAEALRAVLESDLRELEAGIAGTDWQDLRAEVHLEEELLRRLVARLTP